MQPTRCANKRFSSLRQFNACVNDFIVNFISNECSRRLNSCISKKQAEICQKRTKYNLIIWVTEQKLLLEIWFVYIFSYKVNDCWSQSHFAHHASDSCRSQNEITSTWACRKDKTKQRNYQGIWRTTKMISFLVIMCTKTENKYSIFV